MFNPARLVLARRRRKLTKKAIAEALGMDPKTLTRYEKLEVVPPVESLQAIADFLGYPVKFFHEGDIDEPTPDSASFRSLSSMPAKDRDAALSAGAIAFLFSDWVDDRFALPAVDLLDLKEGASPEGAAQALRSHWAIGDRPIRNVVHLLEAKGIRVFSLVENTQSVDAFSLWRKNCPFIFLNTAKTAERSRFDAAHELGHLVLHKHGGAQGDRAAEDQANQFASAFLMPEDDVRAVLPRIRSLGQIVEAKSRWKVSVAALNYRLHKIGVTSDWQYRNFCIQISEQFGKKEPKGINRETSVVWEKIFTELRKEGISKALIAEKIYVPVQELEDLLFQLTNMQLLTGEAKIPQKSKADLRLV